MADEKYETHQKKVMVIGAGGAGIAGSHRGLNSRRQDSLSFRDDSSERLAPDGMAKGGGVAAMGHVYPEDNWTVDFRDTMRGGKLLNNWRMAQIHAQGAQNFGFSN